MFLKEDLKDKIFNMELTAKAFNIKPFNIYFLGGCACILGGYKRISDLLWHIENSLEIYPEISLYLSELQSRGIKGINYGITDIKDIFEQIRILKQFLKLAYWQ